MSKIVIVEPVTLTLYTALGILFGILTGLIPGIHPNTVIFTSLPFYLASGGGLEFYAVFLAGLSISHTFHDFLPAIFISSPDAESALAVINGRSAVESGRGLEIFHYTVYGAFLGLIPVLAISAVSLLYLQAMYQSVEVYMHYILFFFLLFIVLDSENSLEASIIAAFSGVLGVVSFQSGVNQSFVFIPLFSGLFAFPAIIRSLNQEFSVPEQDLPNVSSRDAFSGGLIGSTAGFLAGVVPGIGAAVATTFVSPLMRKDSSPRFMSALGAVNTTDIIFSLFTLYLLDNARSGVAVALQFFSTEIDLRIVLFACIASAPVAAFLALKISDYYVHIVRSLPLSKILVSVIVFISLVTLYFTGITGLLILLISTFVGIAALRTGDRRVCMAVLIVPAILFFSGFGAFI